jgi:hypothetical protein
MHFALIAQTLAEINRNTRRKSAPYKIEQFLLFTKPKPKPQQPWQEQLKLVEMMNAMMGGRDLRAQKGGSDG